MRRLYQSSSLLLAILFLLAACTHSGPEVWDYDESTKFVTDPGEPKLKIHQVCREGSFWYGQRRQCFTETCRDGGACETDGDREIVEQQAATIKSREAAAKQILATQGKSCQRAPWSNCVDTIEALFHLKAYKEAQALKTEACTNQQIECRFVDKKKLGQLKLAKGQKIIWQRDLKETWSPSMFFKSGYYGKTAEYVDVIILKP